MERQIHFFSNDLIDKLVAESEIPANSLSIRIPFSYAFQLIDPNWNDILFAIRNEYFDKDSAVEYAVILLEKNEEDASVLRLASMNDSEITKEALLQEFVTPLAEKVPNEEKAKTEEKMMYVLLSLLYENKKSFEDPLRAIEIVYSDFGHPKSIESFVPYIPAEKPALFGAKKQILRNWKAYLEREKVRFKKAKGQ